MSRTVRRRRAPRLAFAALCASGLAACAMVVLSRPAPSTGHGAPMGSPDAYWSAVAGTTATRQGVERRYFIQAEPVRWNYAPAGGDLITGRPFSDDAKVFVQRRPGRIGSTYTKCLYRGYTDASFGTRTPVAATDRYLGTLGPVIRAEVGDTITVVFRNRCAIPASVHPHGVFYDKASEGAPYNDGSDGTGDAVPTGRSHTYTWRVPERAGPGPGDGSSVMWMYHSHTDEVADTYAGLMGPIVVTAAGKARPDGSPADVEREMFLNFTVMNENGSPFIRRDADHMPRRHDPRGEESRDRRHPHREPDLDDPDFVESNLMHSINGYVYGNMPVPTVARGQRVRWYVMAMGTEVDLHTPHWHGNTVTVNGMRMDVISLLPASMVIADMVPDSPGTWLMHCHVNDHLTAGMSARYRVL